ncbi:MYND finger domain-containing protein [Hirsutella rhossiliensis]
MAMSTVRVEFICQFGARQLIHNHSIPRSLVTEANGAGGDAEYNERFTQSMMPLMKEHESACRMAYCGTEHQKADWKVHKKACVPERLNRHGKCGRKR